MDLRDYSSITEALSWVGGFRNWPFLLTNSTQGLEGWVGKSPKTLNQERLFVPCLLRYIFPTDVNWGLTIIDRMGTSI